MQKIDCSKRFRIWKLEILFFWKELKKKKKWRKYRKKTISHFIVRGAWITLTLRARVVV